MLSIFYVRPSILLFYIFFNIHMNLTEKVSPEVSTIDLAGERGSTKALTIFFILLLLSKFSNFPSHYMVYDGEVMHIPNFVVGTGCLKKLVKSWWSFVHFMKIIVCVSYAAYNFWEIISKRILIIKSHEGHLKHSRKSEIRNFPLQSNHGGLPKVVNSINHS